MLLIEWTPTARLDLLEILGYIAERNEQAAYRLFERIEQDLEHAAQHPYLFKSSPRMPGLREIVTHPNYIVFYQVTAASIKVVNVVHARREFP